MRPPRSRWLLLLLALGLGLGACGKSTTGPTRLASDPRPFDPAVNRTWTVETIQGEPADSAQPATIEFRKSGKLVGFSGLNRFTGSWTATDHGLTLAEIGQTEIAGPEDLVRQDDAYAAGLEKLDGWRLGEDQLHLLAGDRIVFALRSE